MTDIVERLRGYHKDSAHGALHEAADEIERLQQLCDARQDALSEAGLVKRLRVIRAATIEECAKPLEQIRQVCADNAGERSNHKMALDFVHQIAIRALKEQK